MPDPDTNEFPQAKLIKLEAFGLQPKPPSEASKKLLRYSHKLAGLPGFRNVARGYLTPARRSAPSYFGRSQTDWVAPEISWLKAGRARLPPIRRPPEVHRFTPPLVYARQAHDVESAGDAARKDEKEAKAASTW
jgi:hypothetical protein